MLSLEGLMMMFNCSNVVTDTAWSLSQLVPNVITHHHVNNLWVICSQETQQYSDLATCEYLANHADVCFVHDVAQKLHDPARKFSLRFGENAENSVRPIKLSMRMSAYSSVVSKNHSHVNRLKPVCQSCMCVCVSVQ